MSGDSNAVAAVNTSSCASCGIVESDDVKLKNCTACYLLKCCSIECQKDHRKQHKRDCKKRVAELRDEVLFKQPESTHMRDCPICMIPLPFDQTKSVMMECCSKVICVGCSYANRLREEEMRLEHTCPFCRKARPVTDEECDKRRMKRVEANDPFALLNEGTVQYEGKNYIKAAEYWTRAAELGNMVAHCKLAIMYQNGMGIGKDKGKEIHHLEEAAIGGHPTARCLLGQEELNNGNAERAVKHCIIGATQGCDFSMKALMKVFKMGLVEKDVLTSTLREHQAAVDATKSPQRETAAKYRPR